jgi:hypothetical protein
MSRSILCSTCIPPVWLNCRHTTDIMGANLLAKVAVFKLEDLPDARMAGLKNPVDPDGCTGGSEL